MEIGEIELNGFAEKLFSPNPRYTDSEYELVEVMRSYHRQYRKRFSEDEMFQHGWCVLRARKRETLMAFEKGLRYQLLRKELFKNPKYPTFYIQEDMGVDGEQDKIALADIIEHFNRVKPEWGIAMKYYLVPVDEFRNRPTSCLTGELQLTWYCQKRTHRYPIENTTNQGGQRCV